MALETTKPIDEGFYLEAEFVRFVVWPQSFTDEFIGKFLAKQFAVLLAEGLQSDNRNDVLEPRTRPGYSRKELTFSSAELRHGLLRTPRLFLTQP